MVKESACNAGDLDLIPESGNPLEKEMATHSSIIDWKISWTEEPGGLQSMGSQRVGHNRVTNTYLLSPKSKGMSFMWDSPHRVSLHGLLVTRDFGE